jgi:DNA polymerase-4
MSVLCCRVPSFLINLAQRQQPELANRPLALLGPDECICAASPSARQSGVRAAMSTRQALTLCPGLVLQPASITNFHNEQRAFLHTLASCGLPVEALNWGAAYLDLHTVARTATQVQSLAAELGRQVRKEIGQLLQPAIGWDSGKFTARAAALRTAAGKMRLVGKADEVSFLAPLPASLLPLPPEAL